MASEITVAGLYRYPVKGLSAEPLASVHVDQGETLPFDRVYAIENGPGRFDPENPKHLPKVAFLMLMRNERLATLQTEFDTETHVLTIKRGGKTVTQGNLSSKTGRAIIEQFMATYMRDGLRGAPRVVSAPGHAFTDVAAKAVHIVNLASLAELERVMGRPLDPLRFRPNIVLTGAPAWVEFGWVGKELRVGSSGVRLDVFTRTDRCAATDVDPATGVRDTDIPAVLQRQWGHMDFGIYARVSERGTMAVGDGVSLPA